MDRWNKTLPILDTLQTNTHISWLVDIPMKFRANYETIKFPIQGWPR